MASTGRHTEHTDTFMSVWDTLGEINMGFFSYFEK